MDGLTVWLTGSKGMLGREVLDILTVREISFVASDREVDITDSRTVLDFLHLHKPSVIVNCAAYTAVDQAEVEIESAEALNGRAPGLLAAGAREIRARLIHISTDYVFDGSIDRPLPEDEPANPLGIYGRTKRDGEVAILSSGCFYDIVRTSWLYGRYGTNFVETILHNMAEHRQLKVVNDQIGSPTWAVDLAEFLVYLASHSHRESSIYHFSNEGRISWYDFAVAIRDEALLRGILKRSSDVTPCKSSEYPAKTRRPAFSLLSKEKIKQEFQWEVPGWRFSLQRYLDEKGLEK